MTEPAAGVGRHTEGMSLYVWGESLKACPQVIGDFAAQFERLAAQAEDEQPADSGLSDQIRAVAAQLRAAETAATDWHPTFRRQHDADIARVETPRKGSAHIEERADAGRARRDM
jgi:hypothetical protein